MSIRATRHAGKNFVDEVVELNYVTLKLDLKACGGKCGGPTLVTKERSEDPLIVTFDSVERQH